MTQNTKHLVGAATTGIIFLLALCAPLYLYSRIEASQAYAAQIAGEISKQTQREQILALTRQSLADTKDQRAKLDALALPSDGAADFIDAVEQTAKGAGVSIDIGSVSVTPKKGSFDALSLSVTAGGSFSSAIRFLKLVETLPYASTVSAIALNAVESAADEKGTTQKVVWKLTGTITVPIHKQQ